MDDIIYFIPARKGSRRLIDKNIRIVGGLPMIEWTLRAVQGKNVLVSTDDERIISMASTYGFNVHTRPSHVCRDDSTMKDVLISAIDLFGSARGVCVLYPTSPFRTAKQVEEAVDVWRRRGGTEIVMSVERIDHRPFGLMNLTDADHLRCMAPACVGYYRSQDMPVAYRANGAIYVIPVSKIRDGSFNAQLFDDRTWPFEMDKLSSFEVDNELDLVMANKLMGPVNRSSKPADYAYRPGELKCLCH